MNNSKTCVLCPNKIAAYQKLCYKCYAAYKQYMNTEWFKDLVIMETKQDQINSREHILFDHTAVTAVEGKIRPFTNPSKLGRPTTSPKVIDNVLDIYDNYLETHKKKLATRKIAKMLDNKVSYETVRAIIKK